MIRATVIYGHLQLLSRSLGYVHNISVKIMSNIRLSLEAVMVAILASFVTTTDDTAVGVPTLAVQIYSILSRESKQNIFWWNILVQYFYTLTSHGWLVLNSAGVVSQTSIEDIQFGPQ